MFVHCTLSALYKTLCHDKSSLVFAHAVLCGRGHMRYHSFQLYQFVHMYKYVYHILLMCIMA